MIKHCQIKNYGLLSLLKSNYFFLFLVFISCLSFFILLIPSWREKTRELFLSKNPRRQILSSLSVRLFSDNRSFRVLKVKTQEGLFIEVYKHSLQSKPPLLFDRIKLPYFYNGYFHVRKQAVSLSVFDLDKDKDLEIIAPTFDQDLIAHLNVYTYNKNKKRFEDF